MKLFLISTWTNLTDWSRNKTVTSSLIPQLELRPKGEQKHNQHEQRDQHGHEQDQKQESFRRHQHHHEPTHDSSKNIVFIEERKILVIPTVESPS